LSPDFGGNTGNCGGNTQQNRLVARIHWRNHRFERQAAATTDKSWLFSLLAD
jgi:hypothetical protein